MRNRTAVAILAASVLSIPAADIAAHSAEGSTPQTGQLAKRQYRACPEEDGASCIWHNQGPGFSFVSNTGQGGTSTRVYRVSDKLADKLQARHGKWHRPGDYLGQSWDTTHGDRSAVITPGTVVSIGGTSFAIKPSGVVLTS